LDIKLTFQKNASNKLWEFVVFLVVIGSYALVIIFGWKGRQGVCKNLLLNSGGCAEESGWGRQQERSRDLHRQMNRNLTIQVPLSKKQMSQKLLN
jgi:hypothetical protein